MSSSSSKNGFKSNWLKDLTTYNIEYDQQDGGNGVQNVGIIERYIIPQNSMTKDNDFNENFHSTHVVQQQPYYKHTIPLSNQKDNASSSEQKLYSITLMFLHQSERSKRFLLNRLAACWTRSSVIHVEIFFEHDMVSCLVGSNIPVRFEQGRVYSQRIYRENPHIFPDPNKRWESITITLSVEQYDKVYQFCRSQEGRPFDQSSIYCFPFVPCKIDFHPEKEGWICSRLIASALLHAGVLDQSVDIIRISPVDLLNYFKNLSFEKKKAFKIQHQETYDA